MTTLFPNYAFRSVKDYGAVGNGVADDTAAVQNAIRAYGTVWFPPGTYKTTSKITFGSGAASGEDFHLIGYNAAIVGNFADFLLARNGGQDNESQKMIEGLGFINSHLQGGCIYFPSCFANFRCCYFSTYNVALAVGGGNQGARAEMCNFQHIGDLSNPRGAGSIGIAFSGLGCTVQNCNFIGWDHAVRIAQEGGNVLATRFENCQWGIRAAEAITNQKIVSTASASSGTRTRLTLNHTLFFPTGTTVVIEGIFSGTCTKISNTVIEIVKTYVAGQGVGSRINATGVFSAGTGYSFNNNEFEACIVGIRMDNCSSAISNMFQIHEINNAPFPLMTADTGIIVPDGKNAIIIMGNEMVGPCTRPGGIINEGSAPGNSLVTANWIQCTQA